ncbi:hypothetical protein [Mycobacteroides abscessus]|uniref:Cap15 family cyclic dinucleotide receptor domain-containing protein n=2 Tax=Mycobacteroides abscessus TaxID=36809 RepID=UPI00078DD698|nr:hypothetical protein A3O06_09560 [Mycobacteroides abscessus]ANO23804.1 hypothetical protein BAB79_09555 [Mycobacteroides abscessus]
METSNRAKITAYVMLGVVSLVLFLAGLQIPAMYMKILSSMPLMLTVAFAGYDKWIWRWPGIIAFAKRPWLGGTWRGTLTSYRVDEATGTAILSQHDVILTIEQGFTSIRLVLMTVESKSRSFAAEFVTHGTDDYTLLYTYDNTPKLAFRDHSKIHRGSTSVDVHGKKPTRLECEYWTNRDTKGAFTVDLISRDRVGTFDEGRGLQPSELKGGA